MSIPERLFGWSTRFLPRRLREEHGGEMRVTFRRRLDERLRRGGHPAAAGYLIRAVADVMATGFRERMRAAGPTIRRTSIRDTGGGGMTAELWTDVKVASRRLARSPGFAAAAVVVLALGIGANTAIFSAVKAALLTPPPYPEAQRLVLLDLTDSSTVRPGPARPFPWSYPKYRILAGADRLPIAAVAAYAVRSFTLAGNEAAERVSAEVVTPAYLNVLGLSPAVGRNFRPDDDAGDSDPVALLSHGVWEERYGADPGVVGRSISVNGDPVTVVGVAPAGFRGLSGDADLWLPVHTGAGLLAPFLVQGAQSHWLQAVGRLEAGATMDAVRSGMTTVAAAVTEAHPDSDPTVVRGGDARRLVEARRHPGARRSLLVLAAAAGLLLVVACANLAGLLLARARDQDRATAVRLALGASRWRAARGFLVESLLLALAGGAAAVLVAHVGVDLLVAAWPERFLDGAWNLRSLDLDRVRMDGGVLAFALGLAVLTGLAFGAVPALSASRRDPGRQLRKGAAGALGSRGGGLNLRAGLVAGEIAVTLVLIVGAGLLLRSLGQLQAVERGYDTDRLLVVQYDLPRSSRWADQPVAFHEEYLERLRALPDVESAAMGSAAPMSGHWMISGVRRAGSTTYAEGSEPGIGVQFVSPGYFSTLGVDLVSGRTFGPEDRRDSPPVVLLSRTAAEELFPEGDAVGRRIAMRVELTPEGSEGAEVVGVVDDVLYDPPGKGVMPEAYVSMRQQAIRGPRVLLRTRGEPLSLVRPARRILAEIDPEIPLHGARSLSELEAAATADTRVLGLLLATFAGLALLLAGTGVWAIVAYAVSRRTRELGLRIALGAEPAEVVGLVLRRGVVLAVAGIAAGAGGAWALNRVFPSLLYEVSPSDPVTFGAGAALLLAVSLLAAWLPARRATRADPMEALRAE